MYKNMNSLHIKHIRIIHHLYWFILFSANSHIFEVINIKKDLKKLEIF